MNQFPNDKSTVFSIVPFPIREDKPGIYPGFFTIQSCLDDSKPESLVIHCSDHLISSAGRKQPIRVVTPSYEIAKSIVVDFLDGQFFTTPEAHPGITWVQGEISTEEFLSKNKAIYQQMKETQKRWFVLVVNKTQDDWNKYHNSRVVSDQARFAVRALGLDTPEWMTNETIGLEYYTCPACSTKNNPLNIVCSGCSAIFTPALKNAKTSEEKLAALTFTKR